MRPRPEGRWSFNGLLLPLLSGALLAACFPPFHPVVLPFVALAPFAVHLGRLEPSTAGGRSAFRAGSVLGAAYFGLLLHWMVPALGRAGPGGLPAYLAVVLLLAIVTGGVGWAAHGLRRRWRVPLWLALAVAWTAGEWLRGHLPGGLAFPWLGLGTSLTSVPRALGLAEVAGVRGVTFWIVLVNGLVATAALRPRGPRMLRPLVAAALVVAVPVAGSLWRASALEGELRPAARITLLRTAIPVEVERDGARAVEWLEEQLQGAGMPTGTAAAAVLPESTAARPESAAARPESTVVRSGLVDTPPDLVVWPETTLPGVLAPGGRAERGDSIARRGLALARDASRAFRAPVLAGAFVRAAPRARGEADRPDRADEAGEPVGRHNGAVLVDPEGPTGFVYRKRRLVPLVERAGLLAAPPAAGDLVPGTVWPVARLAGGARFGILICFESAFPSAATAYRSRGADFLVNVTNDDWFGTGGWIPGRAALAQHPAHLVMRAVENRVGVARSANGGAVFFVDPLGRIHDPAPGAGPASVSADIRTTDVLTLYTRTGDWLGPGSLLLVLAGLLVPPLRG